MALLIQEYKKYEKTKKYLKDNQYQFSVEKTEAGWIFRIKR